MKREPNALIGLSVADTTLAIGLAGGGAWSNSRRYIIPNISTATRQFECVVDSGVWSYSSHTTPVLNTTYYNDVDNGLVALSSNKYGVTYVYRGIESEDHLYTVLGTQQYDSMTLAQASSILSNVPALIKAHALFVGRICYKQGATTNADWVCEGAFDTIFNAASAITDHGLLSGLSDDDHTQYYNATRANTWLSTKTTGDLASTTDKRYVTDAQLTVIGNTSGTNTGDVNDATITVTDVTTNNASTSKHGWFPKLPTASGKYLRDDMTWQTVSGSGLSQQQIMAISSMRM
jgi:hypothetical protein